jgi:hypothetical protein
MGERRITTTGGDERSVSGAAIDKFASQLEAICSRATTRATMPPARSGTAWSTSVRR